MEKHYRIILLPESRPIPLHKNISFIQQAKLIWGRSRNWSSQVEHNFVIPEGGREVKIKSLEKYA